MDTAQFPNEGFICAMKSWRRSTLRRCMAAISYSSSSAVALSKTGQVTRVSALTNMGFSKTINLNQSTLHCICIKEVIAFYLNWLKHQNSYVKDLLICLWIVTWLKSVCPFCRRLIMKIRLILFWLEFTFQSTWFLVFNFYDVVCCQSMATKSGPFSQTSRGKPTDN